MNVMRLMFLFGVVFSLSANAENIWKNAPYEPTSVAMELIQVSAHSYYVQGPPGTPTDNGGFMSNAGFVVTDEGVVVFDSLSTPSLAYLLLSKIRSVTDKPIMKVVVSHYHADHIYGLQVFKALGAEIIAPIGAKEYLSSPNAEGRLKQRRESLFPWVNENTHLVTPDRFVDAPYSFRLGDLDFVIQPLGPAHSQGDQTLYVKQDRTLFVGDLVFEGRIPFVATAKPKRWMDNLANLDMKKLNVIVPGHGPVSSNPKKAVQFTLGYLRFVYDNMARAVEDLVPFDEAYAEMDWSAYKKMPAFQANRVNAYSVYLGLEAASVGE